MTDLVQIANDAVAKNLAALYSPNTFDHFPFPTIREAQKKALQAWDRLVAENKRFLIIEAPTGVGKSGIAMAIASKAKVVDMDEVVEDAFQPGAYVLSPQKTLTAQYMKDFEVNGLLELKGRSNYWCDVFGTDCDDAKHVADEDECKCEDCPYKMAKRAFMNNPIGVTNFAYYLNETQYGGQLKNRECLLLDEGHNTEGQVLGFADTTISRERMNKLGLGRLPVFEPGQNMKCKNWLAAEFIPACQRYMTGLDNEIKAARLEHQREIAAKFAKELGSWNKFVCRLNRFMASEDLGDWLCFTTEEDKKKGTVEELIIRPLTATLFAEEILFKKARRVVIMSATILDFQTFMRNLGINPKDAICLAMDSEFPVENRPVFYMPVGNMGYKHKEKTLPAMLRAIEKLMDKYVGKKGIIHTHSYSLTKAVVEHLSQTKHAGRIITHTSKPGSRDSAVLQHMDRVDDTVLISPSMNEGLDLKEDLGRFCIICKVPYPNLKDPYMKARMQRDPDYYQWLTALAIVQATGRVVRSKTDRAHCYILDEGFGQFLNRAGRMLPQWWLDAIVRLRAA